VGFFLDFDFENIVKSLVLSLLSTVPVFLFWGVLEYLRGVYWPQLFSFLPAAFNMQSLPTFVISFLIVFVLFTFLNMKRTPAGLRAYLFFPESTLEEDRAFDYHQKHDFHRVVVNLKTQPYVVYDLTLGSYAWKIVAKAENHGRRMWVEATDNPNDSDFLQKWCKKNGYLYSHNIPDRKELLAEGPLSPAHHLDRRFKHLEYVGFYPWYCYFFLPKRGIPHRRLIMNKSANKAFNMRAEQWIWARTGRINGDTKIASLRRHHAKKWAQEHGFEYCNRFPDMTDDLLAEK
jgi:hypothetical protein